MKSHSDAQKTAAHAGAKPRIDIEGAMLLYAVTDRAWLGKRTLEQCVEDAIAGGATCVQIREKNISHDEYVSRARAVKAVCRQHGVPFIVNDDPSVAAECGADGVHIGQDDASPKAARAAVGPDAIVGVSAQTVEEAKLAEAEGADYLGVGAVFPTSTKLDAIDVSRSELQAICDAVSIPVVAIGGITRENVRNLIGTGVNGIAVVSALFAQDDIEEAARMLSRASEVASFLRNMRGAVFDLDGTLVDSMPTWGKMGNIYLATQGIEARPGLDDELRPTNLEQAADLLRAEYPVKESREEVMAHINRLLEDMYFNTVPLKPGVREFIDMLADVGVPMAVATATSRYLTEAALKRNGVLDKFSAVVTCGELGCDKSTTTVFDEATRLIGSDPAHTYIFEDAIHALETAMTGEYTVVACHDDFQAPYQDQVERTCHRYVESLSELTC